MDRQSEFDPERYSDVPLYNTAAAAESAGVPAITLRSWERRYGVPEPQRDRNGYRLYSERDIARCRWLRRRSEEGVGVSRAVGMLRRLEAMAAQPEPQPNGCDHLVDRLLAALTNLNEQDAQAAVSAALTHFPVEEVVLEVFQPTLHRIGDLWSQGRATVTQEHFASNLIRTQIEQLIRLNPPPAYPSTIVVGCAPGEFHDLGALVLALLLRRRGFGVLYLGANIEPDSLCRDAGIINPAAICLSATTPTAARRLASLYRSLAAVNPALLAFGGQAFGQNGRDLADIPGLYLGTDARAAVDALVHALWSGAPA